MHVFTSRVQPFKPPNSHGAARASATWERHGWRGARRQAVEREGAGEENVFEPRCVWLVFVFFLNPLTHTQTQSNTS